MSYVTDMSLGCRDIATTMTSAIINATMGHYGALIFPIFPCSHADSKHPTPAQSTP